MRTFEDYGFKIVVEVDPGHTDPDMLDLVGCLIRGCKDDEMWLCHLEAVRNLAGRKLSDAARSIGLEV